MMRSRRWLSGLLAIAGAPLTGGAATIVAALPEAPTPATASVAEGPAAGARAPAPFSAHYIATWKSINVGTSDIELKPDASPDTYVYSWTITARGVFRLVYSDDVVQKSRFSLLSHHVRPDRYRATQGAATVDIDFDWRAGRASGVSETKPVDVPIHEGVQDVMSIQIEIMLDLEKGTLPKTFLVLDKDQVKEFNYTLEGPAKLRTALGQLDTVVVSSQRTGNDRMLRIWFAPALGYAPVQAERYRAGKLEFAMRIKTLKR